ncbi:MAG: SDR family NAD(P)-dependent oxidoreductase, partial [Isosphaeraceae bacterium]|nr:SDR family NAD(P)-dependent oxidoreductase [Isosphaeraceae bacterium]
PDSLPRERGADGSPSPTGEGRGEGRAVHHLENETALSPPQPPNRHDAPDAATDNRASGRIAERLVEIVRERTGYPAEMLNLNLDLEADLGIDSIKRVEILGTLRDSVAGLDAVTNSALMDHLARAKTLGEIVARIESALEPRPAPTANSPEGPPLRRLVLEVVEAPRPVGRSGLVPGGVILLTDDGRGVARLLAEEFRAEGHPVERFGPDRVDLSSPAAVAAFWERARGPRPLAGIIHALPLCDGPPAGLDPGAWSDRMGAEVKGLFLLARAAAADLERSASQGGACLIAATAMGGAFASAGSAAADFFPGQGGLAGLLKTLAREWPKLRTRVVDLDPREPAATLAAWLSAEVRTDDGWPEVGYIAGRRIRLRAVARPLALAEGGPALDLAAGEPVVVTGGARGITAAVAEALARRWRPSLLLIGSSPPPPEAEDPATAGLTSAADLKAALLDQLRRVGRPVGPSDLERAYRSLRNARQIRDTLHRLRAAGAVVEYARADVRDADALGCALDAWRRRYGDPVGLIHGAGVIHDKLLRDKTPESFDRVLGTKLDGALNLARWLRPDALRFAVLFSSVAGRFGNRGQADYAAANEVLNKLAIWLDRRWPGRVLAVNWGPWAGVGMVSDLEEHLGRRGLGMIAPEAGCAALIEELRLGRKGEVEVILASELGTLDGPLPIAEADPAEVAR